MGKSRCFSLGLSDTPSNWIIAKAIQDAVKADLVLGRFNPDTFDLYLPNSSKKPNLISAPKEIKTLQDLWISYLLEADKKIAQSTKSSVLDPLSKKIQSFKKIKIGVDESEFIDSFSHLKIVTQHSQLTRIRSAYNWAEKKGLIPKGSNQLIIIPRLQSEDIEPPDPLTDDEVKSLLEECVARNDTDLLYLIKFLLYTGCRPSEAFGLRITSINLSKNQITFENRRNKFGARILEQSGTKTKRKRFFPINSQLKQLIHLALKKARDSNSLYLLNKDGKPWDSSKLRTLWEGGGSKQRLDKNGIIPSLIRKGSISSWKTPYNLRDTYISHAIIKGYSPSVIAAWVGNSPSMIDKHYFGVTSDVVSPELYD
jgi:integrase